MVITQNAIQTQSIATTVISVVCRTILFVMRLPALLFDLPIFSFSKKISAVERSAIKNILKKGDILLTSDKLFPLWQIAEGLLGSPQYSHAAIYEGNNSVIEATTFHPSGKGVATTEINYFLSGRKKICVVRPSYLSRHNRETMFEWLQQQMDKPYDYYFDSQSDSEMYCSKLVAKAMNVAGLPIDISRFLWCRVYLPDAFIKAAGMKTVYCKRKTILEKVPYVLLLVCLSVALLTNYGFGTVLCAAALGFMIIAGWLQHLKIL